MTVNPPRQTKLRHRIARILLGRDTIEAVEVALANTDSPRSRQIVADELLEVGIISAKDLRVIRDRRNW